MDNLMRRPSELQLQQYIGLLQQMGIEDNEDEQLIIDVLLDFDTQQEFVDIINELLRRREAGEEDIESPSETDEDTDDTDDTDDDFPAPPPPPPPSSASMLPPPPSAASRLPPPLPPPSAAAPSPPSVSVGQSSYTVKKFKPSGSNIQTYIPDNRYFESYLDDARRLFGEEVYATAKSTLSRPTRVYNLLFSANQNNVDVDPIDSNRLTRLYEALSTSKNTSEYLGTLEAIKNYYESYKIYLEDELSADYNAKQGKGKPRNKVGGHVHQKHDFGDYDELAPYLTKHLRPSKYRKNVPPIESSSEESSGEEGDGSDMEVNDMRLGKGKGKNARRIRDDVNVISKLPVKEATMLVSKKGGRKRDILKPINKPAIKDSGADKDLWFM
jgi:hypothetical protein